MRAPTCRRPIGGEPRGSQTNAPTEHAYPISRFGWRTPERGVAPEHGAFVTDRSRIARPDGAPGIDGHHECPPWSGISEGGVYHPPIGLHRVVPGRHGSESPGTRLSDAPAMIACTECPNKAYVHIDHPMREWYRRFRHQSGGGEHALRAPLAFGCTDNLYIGRADGTVTCTPGGLTEMTARHSVLAHSWFLLAFGWT